MRLQLLAVLGLLCLAGCVTTQETPASAPAPARVTPVQAIMAAAENPGGLSGVFRLQVKGAGWQQGTFYLNSEADYRDQRCLTIALSPSVARELQTRFGTDLATAFVGKTIEVSGTAQRVTVWFMNNGVRTEKYYYQTHVPVRDLAQLVVVP